MLVYSHSKLETFENCALRYRFKYIDRIEKPDEQGVEAFLGKRVHEGLQKLYEDLRSGRTYSLDEILKCYREEWKKHWVPGIKIVRRGTTERDYLLYGETCLTNYCRRYSPFTGSETLATEEHFQFQLDGSCGYTMQGYIDRVGRRANDVYEIHDYKTSRRLPTQDAVDCDRQLGLYQIALQNARPDARNVELLWHYLGHDRTLRSLRQPKQLAQLCETTTKLIERIEHEKQFKPRKSLLCDWCEYKSDCPVWSRPNPGHARTRYANGPNRSKKPRGIVNSLLGWLKKPL
jgi:putative RecB family exonuclease